MAKRDFRALKGGAAETLTTEALNDAADAAQQRHDTISSEALSLLNDLRADVEQAQGVVNRYAQGLARRYKIGPQDKLDVTTGVITRAQTKAGTDG